MFVILNLWLERVKKEWRDVYLFQVNPDSNKSEISWKIHWDGIHKLLNTYSFLDISPLLMLKVIPELILLLNKDYLYMQFFPCSVLIRKT